MLRKSVVILALLLCGMGSQVFALGLGPVTVESTLNQPLRVRIEVLQLGDTRLEDVRVQMASFEDFQRFDVERVGFLSNIRFAVESTPLGNYVVLTSSQIVREPYLNFILDTRWPSGRLLSEHTVLLDLPVFDDQQAAPAVRQPISPVLQRPGAVSADQAPVADDSQPTLPAPGPVTAPTQSVAPILEPEVLDPPAPDSAETEPEPAPEPASVTEESEPEQAPEPALVTEAAEPDAAPEPAPEPEQAQAAPEEVAAETATEPTPQEPQAQETPPQAAEPAPEQAIAASEEAPTPGTITSSASDTLSDIALRVRPDNSVSIQQTMLALQQLNPDAFENGNINLLRQGEILRIPSLQQIQDIDPREAIDEVTRQNQQLVADVQPLAAPADAAPAQEEQAQGQLSVVSGDDEEAIDASTGIGELGDAENAELDLRIAELENLLALRQEEADRARIERAELDSRLQDLEAQIADAQEIIRLQDLQLAQLQQSLAEAAAQAEAEAAAQAAALEAAQAEAAAQAQVAAPSSLVDDLLRVLTGNTLVMGFSAGLLVLLLVLLMLRRNRRVATDSGDFDEMAEEFEASEAAASAGVSAADDEEDEDDLDRELDDIIGFEGDDDTGEEEEDSRLAGMPPLARADGLIAQGQLGAAEDVLRETLQDEPDQHDLRIKLCEVLARRGDLTEFDQQAGILAAEMSPIIDRSVKKLRDEYFDADELALSMPDDDEEEEPQDDGLEAEFATNSSFLDDLGIDLDAFEDEDEEQEQATDSTELSLDDLGRDDAADETEEQEQQEKQEEQKEQEEAEEDLALEFSTGDEAGDSAGLDTDAGEDMDITFDLGGSEDDETAGEDASNDDEEEEAEAASLDALLDEDQPESEAGVESVDFEIDLDTRAAEPDVAAAAEAEDLETFEFDSGADTDAASPAPEQAPEADADDDFSLDFDVEVSAPAAASADSEQQAAGAEVESLDFDLSDADADTVIEKIELDDSGAEEPEAGARAEADNELDVESFDFDLDEFEVEEEAAPGADADEESLDLDTDELKVEAAEPDAAEADSYDIELELEDDSTDAASEDADPAAGEDEDSLDDLEFLSDEDEVEIESVGEIEEVELLVDDEETATKLELAYAYQKMGDLEGAREILQEVINEGNDEQVKEAEKLMSALQDSAD